MHGIIIIISTFIPCQTPENVHRHQLHKSLGWDRGKNHSVIQAKSIEVGF